MKVKRFFRKVWNFIKRNTYALAVSACVVLVLALITITAVNVAGNDSPVIEPDQPIVPSGSETIIEFAAPVEDPVILKGYADDHLLEDKTSEFWQTHQGIDYKATEGTKVFAVYDGVVEKVDNSTMDGIVITIRHSNNLVSVYKCLGKEALVSKDDKVVKGQEIGSISTNLTEKADGPHLHFELYENDKLVDPTPYFEGGK